MNRAPILAVALLALLVAACSSQQTASVEATVTIEATPEPPPEATAEPPESTDDSTDDGTALDDLIPDELNGVPRTDVPGLEAFIAPMLAQEGVDASEVEFSLVTYGEGADAVTLNAFRIPEMDEATLEILARSMAGAEAQSGGSAEAVTVGGKSVLRMIAEDEEGAAYLYFSSGAVFTVVSKSEDLAEQLLSELP